MANTKSPTKKKETNKLGPQGARPQVPKGKETVLGLYVTAKEAYEMWKEDPEKVKIIDCRTTEGNAGAQAGDSNPRDE